MKHLDQLSVPLPAELKTFVAEAAARDDRSLAGQIRHYVAQAARAASSTERRAA